MIRLVFSLFDFLLIFFEEKIFHLKLSMDLMHKTKIKQNNKFKEIHRIFFLFHFSNFLLKMKIIWNSYDGYIQSYQCILLFWILFLHLFVSLFACRRTSSFELQKLWNIIDDSVRELKRSTDGKCMQQPQKRKKWLWE